MPDAGSIRDGYAPIVEAFTGGLEVGVYSALALALVWMVASTVRRLAGAA